MNESNGNGNRKQRRPHRPAKEWAQLVMEWKASGLSAPAFARQRGINEYSLWKWAAHLRRNEGTQGEAPPTGIPSPSPRFVAVEVKDASKRRGFASASRIEISLPCGTLVRVSGDAAPETLSTVIRLLTRETAC